MLQGHAYSSARFFILVDENTVQHCLPRLVRQVRALQESTFFELPNGEKAKSIAVATQLWEALLQEGADNDSVIVNLGGGTVCDVGGFVAAAFHRGIRYLNVPTTLLAMVDAAVGGKTAVNLDHTKNPLGFFHQPEAVVIDTAFLDTLAPEELTNGRFELTKMQLLAGHDPELGTWESPLDETPSQQVVAACAQMKQAVCTADPYDRSVRRMLNLGHTFAHAIEGWSATESATTVPHGIAVGLGIWCALWLSVKKLRCPDQLLNRYTHWLQSAIQAPSITLHDTESIIRLMHRDKKTIEGNCHLVLLKDEGVPVIDVQVNDNEVRDTLLQLDHQLHRQAGSLL